MELGVVVFFVSLPFLSRIGESIRFQVESGNTKCISDDIRINSLTIGEYSVVNPNEGHPLPEHNKITASFYSVKEKRYHYARLVESGRFVVKVEEDGDHVICFLADNHNPKINITLDFTWRTGVTTKDWSDVAKKTSVDTMELELKKMEDIVDSIHEEMFQLQYREEEMLERTKDTNSMMGYLSLVSLFLCLSVACLQLWYLKSFFEKKKII